MLAPEVSRDDVVEIGQVGFAVLKTFCQNIIILQWETSEVTLQPKILLALR